MDIESIPSRNQLNKLISTNALISEEELNQLYEELYLAGDFWSIGLNIFDRLIDIEYDNEEERKHWRTVFAGTFDDDLRMQKDITLEIGALKQQIRQTLRTLIADMRSEL